MNDITHIVAREYHTRLVGDIADALFDEICKIAEVDYHRFCSDKISPLEFMEMAVADTVH